MAKRFFVYRDGKVVEVNKNQIDQQSNVQSTGKDRDDMHSCYELGEVRQQHGIDSNRAEYAHNKERGC